MSHAAASNQVMVKATVDKRYSSSCWYMLSRGHADFVAEPFCLFVNLCHAEVAVMVCCAIWALVDH